MDEKIGDPRQKADRRGLLTDDTPDEILESMGEAKNTTSSKRSRVNLFLEWLKGRGLKLPAEASSVQKFAASMTRWEYQDPKQYTSSVWQWLVEPVKIGEQSRLIAGPAILRHISDVEQAISRTVKDHSPWKADIILRSSNWDNLTDEDRCIASVWALSSVRGDTFEGIQEQDLISISPNEVELYIRDDKVKNQRGRRIKIGCNCVVTAKGGMRFCPFHGKVKLTKGCFPVKKAQITRITKKLKITGHSFRRAFATRMRASERELCTEIVAQHAGWEPEAKQWSSYTADFAEWVDRIEEFIPYAGVLRRMETESGEKEKGHTFAKKKARVKKTVLVSAKSIQDRLGRTVQKDVRKKVKALE
jgi:hypothetical protein